MDDRFRRLDAALVDEEGPAVGIRSRVADEGDVAVLGADQNVRPAVAVPVDDGREC